MLLNPLGFGPRLGFCYLGAPQGALTAAIDRLAVNPPVVESTLKERGKIQRAVETIVAVLGAVGLRVESVQNIARRVTGTEERCQDPGKMA